MHWCITVIESMFPLGNMKTVTFQGQLSQGRLLCSCEHQCSYYADLTVLDNTAREYAELDSKIRFYSSATVEH